MYWKIVLEVLRDKPTTCMSHDSEWFGGQSKRLFISLALGVIAHSLCGYCNQEVQIILHWNATSLEQKDLAWRLTGGIVYD